MKCIGVKDGYHLYHDLKHDEYLLLNPNFRFNRCMNHAGEEIGKWANHMIDVDRKKGFKNEVNNIDNKTQRLKWYGVKKEQSCEGCKHFVKKDRYCKLLQINWIPENFGCVRKEE